MFFKIRGYRYTHTFLNCSSLLEILLIKIYYGFKIGTWKIQYLIT